MLNLTTVPLGLENLNTCFFSIGENMMGSYLFRVIRFFFDDRVFSSVFPAQPLLEELEDDEEDEEDDDEDC